jgi:hypothetical protein
VRLCRICLLTTTFQMPLEELVDRPPLRPALGLPPRLAREDLVLPTPPRDLDLARRLANQLALPLEVPAAPAAALPLPPLLS